MKIIFDAIYLNFAKAFDKVDYGVFLQNLSLLGIRGRFFPIIKNADGNG